MVEYSLQTCLKFKNQVPPGTSGSSIVPRILAQIVGGPFPSLDVPYFTLNPLLPLPPSTPLPPLLAHPFLFSAPSLTPPTPSLIPHHTNTIIYDNNIRQYTTIYDTTQPTTQPTTKLHIIVHINSPLALLFTLHYIYSC